MEKRNAKGPAALIMLAKAGAVTPANFKATYESVARKVSFTKPDGKISIVDARSPLGYDVYYSTSFTRVEGQQIDSTVIGANPGNQFQLVALTIFTSRTDRKEEDQIESEFKGFYSTVRYAGTANSGASLLKPPPGAGGLDGMFSETKLGSPRFDAFGGVNYLNFETEEMFFMPDGRFVDGPPVAPEEFEAACTVGGKRCGVYIIKGGQIERRTTIGGYNFYRVDVDPFSPSATGVKIGRHSLTKAAPVNGMKLNGTYRYFSYTGTAGAPAPSGFSGGVASEQIIAFTPDGRFQSNRLVAMSFDQGGVSGSGTNKKGGGVGRYEVKGYTLLLRYDDGRSERSGFYMPDTEKDGAASDGLIRLGGRNFLKNKNK